MYTQKDYPVEYNTDFYAILHKYWLLFALRWCPAEQRFKSIYSLCTLWFYTIRGVNHTYYLWKPCFEHVIRQPFQQVMVRDCVKKNNFYLLKMLTAILRIILNFFLRCVWLCKREFFEMYMINQCAEIRSKLKTSKHLKNVFYLF